MSTVNPIKCCAVAASVALLTACGFSSNSSSYGTTGTTLSLPNDSVVTTPLANGSLSVAIGSSTSLSVAFTTDDGATATKLSITSGLSNLPAGWTGPAS